MPGAKALLYTFLPIVKGLIHQPAKTFTIDLIIS